MQLKFLKNAGSYQKGRSYDVPKMAARVLIHTGQALLDQKPMRKQITAPSNRSMTAAKPKPAADASKPTKRKSPPKKKNEYETKDLHAKNEE